jgi:hypothetical protein
MVDNAFLRASIDAEIAKSRAGEIPLLSLVSRLEGAVLEVVKSESDGADELADAWERLEVLNALALDHKDGSPLHRWLTRKARRELTEFERVASRVLGITDGIGF